MSRYTSATDADRQEMLAAIGVETIDDLFADVPEGVRLGRALDLPPGKPEQEVYARLRDLAAKNVSAEDELSFLGAGMYDHYVPALIDSILQRSEFLTPYTPYQPEISQGGLQVMFEYQTAISRADRPAGLQRVRLRGPERRRRGRAGSRTRTPRRPASWSPRACTRTAARRSRRPPPAGGRRSRRSRSSNGLTQLGEVGDDVAAIFVGQPNFYGAIEDLEALSAAKGGALLIVQADPLTLGVLRPPGDFDVDICRRRGPDARQPARLRRPELRLLRRQAGLHPPDAGPDRGRDDRRRRPPRLRAHAADARAAHPPREGHAQHLHRAGAERARGHDLPELARPRGHRGARRAARLAHALRPRDAHGDRRRRARCTTSRSCASSRSSSTPTSTTWSSSAPSAASTPATRWATTSCWWRSPSSAPRPTSTASPRC